MKSLRQELIEWCNRHLEYLTSQAISSRDKIYAMHGNQDSNHHVSTGSGKSRARGNRKLFDEYMEQVPNHFYDIIMKDFDSKYKVTKVSDTLWIVDSPRKKNQRFGCGVKAIKRCNSLRIDNMRHTFIYPWRDTGKFKLPMAYR